MTAVRIPRAASARTTPSPFAVAPMTTAPVALTGSGVVKLRGVTAAGASELAKEPSAQPIVGHFQAFRKDRLRLLDACLHAPEDVVELRIGRPTYVPKRPEDIKHVFVSRRDRYAKSRRNVGRRAKRIFGEGLFTNADAAPADAPAGPAGIPGAIDRAAGGRDRPRRGRDGRSMGPSRGDGPRRRDDGAFAAHDGGGDVRRRVRRRDGRFRTGACGPPRGDEEAFNSVVEQPGFMPLTLSPGRRQAIGDLDRRLDLVIHQHQERAAPATTCWRC